MIMKTMVFFETMAKNKYENNGKKKQIKACMEVFISGL